MRQEIRLRDSIALSSIALLAFACVSIAPIASGPIPSAGPTLPGATTTPLATVAVTPTIGLPTPPITAPPPTPTDAPPATPTNAPTATPTDAPTATPTDAPTATPAEQLNFRLDPNYGRVELGAGFVPDPHSQEMLVGGPVNASYLGDGCRGFATSAPDFSVRYSAEDRSLLRFYFVANTEDDATMIVNDPDGTWLCNDDWDATTRDPGIDITDPASGRYDIWVGAYVEGTTIDGILYVTELGSNHP